MLLFRHGGVNPDGPGETEVAVCIAPREASSSRALFARAHAQYLYRLPCCARDGTLVSLSQSADMTRARARSSKRRTMKRARARALENFSACTYCVLRSFALGPSPFYNSRLGSERERKNERKRERARGQIRASVFDAPIGSVLPF